MKAHFARPPRSVASTGVVVATDTWEARREPTTVSSRHNFGFRRRYYPLRLRGCTSLGKCRCVNLPVVDCTLDAGQDKHNAFDIARNGVLDCTQSACFKVRGDRHILLKIHPMHPACRSCLMFPHSTLVSAWSCARSIEYLSTDRNNPRNASAALSCFVRHRPFFQDFIRL